MALNSAFATNGDKSEIPQSSSDGSVSYDKGFSAFYALPPEEGGLFIDRAQFNQLMYDTTSQVLENKQNISNLNGSTYNKTQIDGFLNAKANANATANLTGDQTIQGVKTFSSPVVVPNATANTHAVNLAQLNTKANQATTYTKTEVDTRVNAKANANATVNLTGNQTIAGVKTFSAPPVSATNPTANNQLANKAYVDSRLGKAYITETYVNGSSWYRVWSDKFCEQGGTITTSGKTYVDITFLKTFSNTNYTLNTSKSYGDSNWTGTDYVFSYTTSNFRYFLYSGSQAKIFWTARGYIN